MTDPSGTVWRVRRRWLTRRVQLPRWRGPGAGNVDGWDVGNIMPFDAGFDGWLLALVAVMLVVFVVAPLLLFGIELIALGVVIAGSSIGRAIWTRRWIIEASNQSTGKTYRQEVRGWRRSRRAISEITASVKAGHRPQADEAAASRSLT